MTVYKKLTDLPETNYPFRITDFKLLGFVVNRKGKRFPLYQFTIRYFVDENEVDNDYWMVLREPRNFPIKTEMKIAIITDVFDEILMRYKRAKIFF